MPALKAGIGAKGSILTRLIKPTQVLPNGNRYHRSNVVVTGWFANKKGTVFFEFQHEAARSTQTMHGAARLVKIHEEGPDAFIGQAPRQSSELAEPKISWTKSKARKLLYADIKAGVASEDLSNQEVYTMRPEYAAYCWEMFPGRLKYLRGKVADNQHMALQDQSAFDDFVANNPVFYYNSKGLIQWQGSDAQRLCKKDLNGGLFEGKGKYRRLYNSRPEYNMEFPFENFKDRVRQEIRTAKLLHTIAVRGKAYGNPKNWPKRRT